MVSTICCVHTILRDRSLSFKMGLPGAYGHGVRTANSKRVQTLIDIAPAIVVLNQSACCQWQPVMRQRLPS